MAKRNRKQDATLINIDHLKKVEAALLARIRRLQVRVGAIEARLKPSTIRRATPRLHSSCFD